MEEMVTRHNKILLIVILISFVVTACNRERHISSDIVYLDYQKAENSGIGKLSELLKDIRYVALETLDTCLIDQVISVILTDRYIVLDGGYKNECYVFNKKDGKYLRTIGMWNDPGPTGYSHKTYPLYVEGNEIFLKANYGDKYKVFSLDNGSLLRTIEGKTGRYKWPNDYLYPLNDSTMLQYANNIGGNNRHGLQICTWAGNILKQFPSTNNFRRNKGLEYFISYHNEIIFYRYNNQVHFHEFTSDTIFRLDDSLKTVPIYVIGKGNEIPVAELRNNTDEDKLKRNVKFDHILETDRYLLLMGNRWRNEACVYDKHTKKTIRLEDELIKGFTNDLNEFLPFWPIDRGRGDAQNEVWAIIQPGEYMEGVKITGKNPLGFELQDTDNPVIVIGTLK